MTFPPLADIHVVRGVPSEDAVEAFTEGDCWALALAIHDLSGWPLVIAGTAPHDHEYWEHVLVRHPSGKLLDIEGLHTYSEVRAKWGRTARTTSDRVVSDPTMELMWTTHAVVRRVARTLVRHYEKDLH